MPRRRRFAPRADTGEPRPRRRWLRGVLLSLLGLIPLLVFLAFGVLWLTVPPDNQTLRIAGLSAPVDISFDGNGVPRIGAANERDAAMAVGYVHARDRMFQMELMRRATGGRLSELVGPATLPIDKQMRVLGLGGLAEDDLAAQSPETRALLEAYAAGVNAWIAARGRFAAMEFLFLGAPEPWRPADSLLWGRYMGLWLSTNYHTELTRQALRDKVPPRLLEQLYPPHPPGLPPQAGLMDGGSRYATLPPAGTRVVLGDPPLYSSGSADGPVEPGHDGDGSLRPWPELVSRHPPARPGDQPQHTLGSAGGPVGPPVAPGEGHDETSRLSAAAAARVLAALSAFPAPFTLPSTASDAWAVDARWTDTGAPLLAGDPHLSFDFPGLWYLVRIETPGHVLVGATGPGVPFLVMGHNGQIAWTFTTTGADTQDVYLEPSTVVFTTHEERIKVRGQPDVVLTVRATRHGPVISDLTPGNGPVMAVAMANLAPRDTAATGLLALNHARTVEEAGKAAPLITAPVQNLMVADRTKIGLFVTGRVPIRRAGDGWAPVPGSSALMSTPSPGPQAATETSPAQGMPTRGTSGQGTSGQGTSGQGATAGAPPAEVASGQAAAAPVATATPISGRASSAAPVPGSPASGRVVSAQDRSGQVPAGQVPAGQVPTGQVSPGLAPPALVLSGRSAAAAEDDDPYGWIGFASGDALPHIVAPASGRLVNGNEPVWPANFPVFMGRDTWRDWRSRRIRALLDGAPKHATSDFAAMQVDVVSTYAAELLPTLRVVPGAPTVLRDWDGAMTENAPQPLIFSAWMDSFHHAVLARAGIPFYASSPVFEFVAFVLSPEGAEWCGGDCAPLLKATLDSTMAALTERFGPEPTNWHWGAVHQAVFAHPLLRTVPVLGALTTSRISVPGDGTTLDRGGTNDALEAVHGASYRGVYDLADLERSLFMMAPGQSGNPLSRHARDFLTRWRDGAMVLLAHQPVEVSGTVRLGP